MCGLLFAVHTDTHMIKLLWWSPTLRRVGEHSPQTSQAHSYECLMSCSMKWCTRTCTTLSHHIYVYTSVSIRVVPVSGRACSFIHGSYICWYITRSCRTSRCSKTNTHSIRVSFVVACVGRRVLRWFCCSGFDTKHTYVSSSIRVAVCIITHMAKRKRRTIDHHRTTDDIQHIQGGWTLQIQASHSSSTLSHVCNELNR